MQDGIDARDPDVRDPDVRDTDVRDTDVQRPLLLGCWCCRWSGRFEVVACEGGNELVCSPVGSRQSCAQCWCVYTTKGWKPRIFFDVWFHTILMHADYIVIGMLFMRMVKFYRQE